MNSERTLLVRLITAHGTPVKFVSRCDRAETITRMACAVWPGWLHLSLIDLDTARRTVLTPDTAGSPGPAEGDDGPATIPTLLH
jgi:hypothetical protein